MRAAVQPGIDPLVVPTGQKLKALPLMDEWHFLQNAMLKLVLRKRRDQVMHVGQTMRPRECQAMKNTAQGRQSIHTSEKYHCLFSVPKRCQSVPFRMEGLSASGRPFYPKKGCIIPHSTPSGQRPLYEKGVDVEAADQLNKAHWKRQFPIPIRKRRFPWPLPGGRPSQRV